MISPLLPEFLDVILHQTRDSIVHLLEYGTSADANRLTREETAAGLIARLSDVIGARFLEENCELKESYNVLVQVKPPKKLENVMNCLGDSYHDKFLESLNEDQEEVLRNCLPDDREGNENPQKEVLEGFEAEIREKLEAKIREELEKKYLEFVKNQFSSPAAKSTEEKRQ